MTANKVLETYKHIPTSGGSVEEGYSMFYHKAYKVDGIFQSDAEAKEWLSKHEDVNYQNAKVGAGDFYFKDLRGAPKKKASSTRKVLTERLTHTIWYMSANPFRGSSTV